MNFLKLAYEMGANRAVIERSLTKSSSAAVPLTMGVPLSRVLKTTESSLPAMAKEIRDWKQIREMINQHSIGRLPVYDKAGAGNRMLQESRRINAAARKARFNPSIEGHLSEVVELNAKNPDMARKYVEKLRRRGVI